jgi:hypothetical protein
MEISRADKGFTPKHGFKVFFRSDYGDAKLGIGFVWRRSEEVRPIDSAGGLDRHLAMRGVGCREYRRRGSAAFRWLRPWSSYIRDQWARDAGNAWASRRRGAIRAALHQCVYWGLYNMTEHPDEDFCADTLGGSAANWDTLKDFAELESGDSRRGTTLINFARAGLGTDAAYQRLLGPECRRHAERRLQRVAP